MLIREGLWDLEVQPLKEDAGTFEYFSFIMTKRKMSDSTIARLV
jgi:hypothetical protein